jgi:hypothetical protein
LADEALRIDLSWMIRTGRAVPGRNVAGTLSWTCRGNPSGRISYEAIMADLDYARLVLTYSRTKADGRESVTQEVRLVSTRPHFGGRRWWMICPYRGVRAGKLYMPNGGDRFASRVAWRLGYQSQREASRDKPFSRLNRVQRKLGCREGADEFIRRPKRMWHRTYARHADRYFALARECDLILSGMFARL